MQPQVLCSHREKAFPCSCGEFPLLQVVCYPLWYFCWVWIQLPYNTTLVQGGANWMQHSTHSLTVWRVGGHLWPSAAGHALAGGTRDVVSLAVPPHPIHFSQALVLRAQRGLLPLCSDGSARGGGRHSLQALGLTECPCSNGSAGLPAGLCVWLWSRQQRELASLLGRKPLVRSLSQDEGPRR